MTGWLVAPDTASSVWVAGRPTGYSGGANELAWKSAVAAAMSGISIPAPARIGIEIEFRLRPDQVGHFSPDLDNLVKATVDATAECIGRRPINGRENADDERVDVIVARKCVATDVARAGARIAIWALVCDLDTLQ